MFILQYVNTDPTSDFHSLPFLVLGTRTNREWAAQAQVSSLLHALETRRFTVSGGSGWNSYLSMSNYKWNFQWHWRRFCTIFIKVLLPSGGGSHPDTQIPISSFQTSKFPRLGLSDYGFLCSLREGLGNGSWQAGLALVNSLCFPTPSGFLELEAQSGGRRKTDRMSGWW